MMHETRPMSHMCALCADANCTNIKLSADMSNLILCNMCQLTRKHITCAVCVTCKWNGYARIIDTYSVRVGTTLGDKNLRAPNVRRDWSAAHNRRSKCLKIRRSSTTTLFASPLTFYNNGKVGQEYAS